MGNWKIVNRIAFALGIVFIVFSGIAAIVNYELNTMLYVSAPAKFFDISVLAAALPFVAAAVISFVVQILTATAASPEAVPQADEAQARQEAEKKAQQEAEVQAEQEIDFEEEKGSETSVKTT
jgi:TRAP-type C4-dicarboxylate transport system permease small subunit